MIQHCVLKVHRLQRHIHHGEGEVARVVVQEIHLKSAGLVLIAQLEGLVEEGEHLVCRELLVAAAAPAVILGEVRVRHPKLSPRLRPILAGLTLPHHRDAADIFVECRHFLHVFLPSN